MQRLPHTRSDHFPVYVVLQTGRVFEQVPERARAKPKPMSKKRRRRLKMELRKRNEKVSGLQINLPKITSKHTGRSGFHQCRIWLTGIWESDEWLVIWYAVF